MESFQNFGKFLWPETWHLRHWLHFWQLRTTIWAITLWPLIQSDGDSIRNSCDVFFKVYFMKHPNTKCIPSSITWTVWGVASFVEYQLPLFVLRTSLKRSACWTVIPPQHSINICGYTLCNTHYNMLFMIFQIFMSNQVLQ